MPARAATIVSLKPAEKVALLARAPLFAGCSKRDLRELAAIADVVDVPAGKALTREGEPGREFVVFVSGAAEARRKGRKLRVLGAGDWLGEIALLTGGPRTATVTTTAPSRTLVLRGGHFRSLLERSPAIAYKVLVNVAGLVRQAAD